MSSNIRIPSTSHLQKSQNPGAQSNDFLSAPPPIPFVNPRKLMEHRLPLSTTGIQDPCDLKIVPRKKIFHQNDLNRLFNTIGLNRLMIVLLNLCYHCSKFGTLDFSNSSQINQLIESLSPKSKAIIKIFDELDKWIAEIPLDDQDRQRFGNKSFKIWGRRLESEAEKLHEEVLKDDDSYQWIKDELLFHFKTSFGSFLRLDYGTGHELSFLAYLSILHLTRILTKKDLLTTVLVIYQRYFNTCRSLQEVYRLEPAGSKGAYGLDDHFHLVYVFGSAQLLNHTTLTPSHIVDRKFLSNFSSSHHHSIQLENGSIVSLSSSLFFSAIEHINRLKRGPFHEHSPILYNLSQTVPNWSKVLNGSVKMFQGEILNKLQVMQHFFFTDHLQGVLCWDLMIDDHGGEFGEEFSDDENQNQLVQSKAKTET
ncbi:hypothetical protein O181_001986 [Austropuccinia psidii MF-1]|uniref:Serine/threonine-protein phosphatase 2A activator n=1 Tax=Austropuccinia psidii MF-1 TaxID=1389203 RepID=A0A9Q3BB66_9BASI|nr:hypothetical protein [Austropuccinia psidii MF-1]